MQNKNDAQNAHDLMPADLAAQIPPLYTTDEQGDAAIVYVKLFTPDSSWTWYCTELDLDERLAFGLVVGLETELGYFSLDELREARGPLGLRIERDCYFSPRPLSEIRKQHEVR